MKTAVLISTWLVLALLYGPAIAQGDGTAPTPAAAQQPEELDLEKAVKTGLDILVAGQEGEDAREWPYEGVYRERGQIPIGYRVGGTAIVGLALIESPGYPQDQRRVAAVEKAVDFVLKTLKEPLMASGFQGGYDVRGWGHTYALQFLLRLDDLGAVPTKRKSAVTRATKGLVKTLNDTAIPESGGWNYSRRAGFGNKRNGASPFMTAPTLQTLFLAKAKKHRVSTKVVEEALDALERGRTASGGYAYTSSQTPFGDRDEEALSFMDKLPGSIARMTAVESTLMLAGRGDEGRLRHAVKSFFEHWEQLEVRRQKTGTHIKPYGVAPYYVMYGHFHVAQAIELLSDQAEKDAFRERLRQTFAQIQDQDGSWNDRVFERSKHFGTAFSLMALQAKDLPQPPAWKKSL